MTKYIFLFYTWTFLITYINNIIYILEISIQYIYIYSAFVTDNRGNKLRRIVAAGNISIFISHFCAVFAKILNLDYEVELVGTSFLTQVLAHLS